MVYRRSLNSPLTHKNIAQKTILVVEDNVDCAILIRNTLAKAGYSVFLIAKATDALTIIAKQWIDLAIVNISMPCQDSIGVCRQLRRVMRVPVIALTTIGGLGNQIKFLIDEADDHLTMPVSPNELLVRTKLLLHSQRNERWRENVLAAGDLILDKVAKIVMIDKAVIGLTPNESRLLGCMMLKSGQTVGKEEIIRAVWQGRFYNDSNALRVNIGRLRRKIERNPSKPGYLLTVHGVGYMLCTAGQFAT